MNKETIRQILEASRGKSVIPFPDLVEVTSGFSVIPLDLSDVEDRKLLSELRGAAEHFLHLCSRARRRFQADRVNEVGNHIENEFVEILSTTSLEPQLLGKAGYPNMELRDTHGRITYLESKTTSKGWKSSLRSFYYSSGDKIKAEARHLLIGWRVQEEQPKYWELKGWKLVDLSNLKVSLKNEFNASNKRLYVESNVLAEE